MYIYPRRPERRKSLLVGLLAFCCTALLLLGLILINNPHELLTALRITKPTPTVTPTPEIIITATPTLRPTNTPRPTKTPRPSPTLVPTSTPVNTTEHFWMGRPVPLDATSIIPSWIYLYGSTRHGELDVHHGVEFVNPTGTSVLAVADGEIVVAGDDHARRCGADGKKLCGAMLDYYGNLVVLRLDQTYNDQPVFALCGHMARVDVKVGQRVSAGDQLGTVGATGVALGPHCHFEVRVGVNDYAHTRNPTLWLKPLPGRGVVAGVVQDSGGNPLRSVDVILYNDNAAQDYVQDTATYSRDYAPPVNSDDELHENWAMGDLKAGNYLVRAQAGGLSYTRHITITDGALTFVVFGGP